MGGDPSLRIVPTPGHTPGHQSLMLLERGTCYPFAGDAVFDLERAERARDSGIAATPEEVAQRTHETIRKQLRDFDTVLAPAHDIGVREPSRFPGHVH